MHGLRLENKQSAILRQVQAPKIGESAKKANKEQVMTFATQLKNLRTDLGLSQARSAELLGISRGAIACYESGKREPPDEPIRSKDQILADLERLAQDDAA